MNLNKTATIIGATGLVGSYLLRQLLDSNQYDKIRIIVRSPFSEINHPKLEIIQISFTDLKAFQYAITGSSVVFSCIGTTMKKVNGDKDLYRSIDYDITVNAALFAKKCNCNSFIFISSIGANSSSKNFYLKLKGEIEDKISSLGVSSVHIMQPGFIMGDRNEKRIVETIMKYTLPLFQFFIPSKYRTIQASTIAKTMYNLSLANKKGVFKYQNQQIKAIAIGHKA